MKQFTVSFYTKDYDQEMLDFIKNNFEIDGDLWDIEEFNLQYENVTGCFYTTRCLNSGECLTKQEFKDKIGMTKKGFTLDNLEAGKHVVELRNGLRFVIISSKVMLGLGSRLWDTLDSYNKDLTNDMEDLDVMKEYIVGRRNLHTCIDLPLVWQREENSEALKQYEECENKMKELQEQMNILSKVISEGK